MRPVAVAFVLAASLAWAQADLPPRRKAPLLAWLRSGAYRATFTGEPAVHESAIGVHGRNVRTFYSPTLVEDLRAGRTVFRKGAAMVKELYLGGREEVVGYSVLRKLRRRSGPAGKGWLFYETFDGTNARALYGRGLPVCVSCHRAGSDFLLSEFRP